MKKDKLLKFIETSNRMEEDAIDSYTRHVKAAAEWIDFTEAERKRIVKILGILKGGSEIHRKMLGKLKRGVIKENRNDY